ncbi:MAG: ATP-binding protein [candidate division KSB1 bacterium]|nr:ATP-binding protein [candidate division KSB1 bacterium]
MGDDNAFVQEFDIKGWDFARAGEASCRIKNLLKDIGIPMDVMRRVAIAAYEAEMNVVMYAQEGVMRCEIYPHQIRITLADKGPGIENIELAMQEGFSTATPEMREMGFGAGMGLPNIKRNADFFQIISIVGQGTTVTMEFNI